jgi:hypothetical protein
MTATKLWIIFWTVAVLANAWTGNFPWLIASGFILVATKLNEIQETIQKK